ncbi:MAG: hypothetical protein KGQ70_03995 [Alphaproteobacteria bacterium]|nr:hypothetical protein [Alphaproteobacteria bacterium]
MTKDSNSVPSTTKEARPKRGVKGYLCAAFAAATVAVPAILGGDSHVPAPPAGGNLRDLDPLTLTIPVQQPDLPAAITAFGAVASRGKAAGYVNWEAMLRRQKAAMQNPQTAKKYAAFLDSFDAYADEPLKRMARDVNARVLGRIAYKFRLHPDPDVYWAAPAQTVLAGAGECKAYAVLQYSIMRHLGVPEGRLAMAFVNASGSDKGTSHIVLLLNVAKAGAAQDFIVINDGGPVVDAKLYARPQGANRAWPKPYVFYDALNQDGGWYTALYKKLYAAPVSTRPGPVPAAPKAPRKRPVSGRRKHAMVKA